MKMERDIVGYVDFDYLLSRFGSRDKETVKITYSYNGKSFSQIVSIGFGAVNTEIILPEETIILNEGDDYEKEIKSQLGVRIRNGDALKNAQIKLSGLDTGKLNITQKIKAIYDGETDVTESCKADFSVKIIPAEYIFADEFLISPQASGQEVTLNVTGYFETSTQDVLLVGYDENGILREFKMLPKRIFAYGKNTLSFDITDNNIAYYKLFIWKDILKMKPKYTKLFKIQSTE